LKKKGFKEEKMTQVALYDIGKSTTLECNKRHMDITTPLWHDPTKEGILAHPPSHAVSDCWHHAPRLVHRRQGARWSRPGHHRSREGGQQWTLVWCSGSVSKMEDDDFYGFDLQGVISIHIHV
jgi:hypothetical protein